MFWIGFTVGIFAGVNVGIFIAAMLFSAKAGDEKVKKPKVKLQLKKGCTP